MSNLAIQAVNVSKLYRIGQGVRHNHLRDALAGAVGTAYQRLVARARQSPQRGDVVPNETTLWALRDVSFEVEHGEVIGIVGKNGAGKSTILKILARITEPTSGYVDLYGRVGSLLEVGAGFHSDLTGRENVFLNGAMLGMKRREINQKFDEIVAFAEVDRFIDTPVKYYSSGMYMRLAFAIAAHLDPEILLVDEALAVGDQSFQDKCLNKMDEVARGGRTVIFVSHHMAAVERLCQRVYWLNEGQIVDQGTPSRVIANYLDKTYTTWTVAEWSDPATAPGNDHVRLRRVQVRPANGTPQDSITIRTPFIIECEYWNFRANASLAMTFQLRNDYGLVFDARQTFEDDRHYHPLPEGLVRVQCFVPGDLLNSSWHRLDIRVVRDKGTLVHHEHEVLVFDVADDLSVRGGWIDDWTGAVRPLLQWNTEMVNGEKVRNPGTALSSIQSR